MFERFTDRSRRVVVLSQEEARLLNHNYIGTEHILLGLIHERDGVAARTLERGGVSLESVRSQVTEIIGRGKRSPKGHIPFTPRAKKVLELSLREALRLGHNHIGTEHILLGLIREGGGVATQVLVKLGMELPRTQQTILEILEVEERDPEQEQESASGDEGYGAPVVASREYAKSGSPYEERYGFSRGVRRGKRIEIAGTAPIPADGEELGVTAYDQMIRCGQIALEAVVDLGGDPTDVIRTVMYITDASEADEIGRAHEELFGEAAPAATMVVVAGLLEPQWKVELEVSAVLSLNPPI